MPNETNDNNKGANGDDAEAKATASGKKSDDDKKTGDGEETVTLKKSELEKIESDRDNYRDGLLSKKADERDLKEKEKEKEKENDKDDVDKTKTSTSMDAKQVEEISSASTTKTLRAAAEKSAKRDFLKSHPEYVNDVQWVAMIANLTFKGGEVTKEEILDRMDAALLEHKRSTGKLDEYLEEEKRRAKEDGRIEGQLEAGRGAGGGGDKNEEDKKGSGSFDSPKGEEMAKGMHVDPEKAKKVDISKDNEIMEP